MITKEEAATAYQQLAAWRAQNGDEAGRRQYQLAATELMLELYPENQLAYITVPDGTTSLRRWNGNCWQLAWGEDGRATSAFSDSHARAGHIELIHVTGPDDITLPRAAFYSQNGGRGNMIEPDVAEGMADSQHEIGNDASARVWRAYAATRRAEMDAEK